MAVNGNGTSEHKPEIRLCHIIQWPDYPGYGFNLHAEKNKPGQFIGKIDEGSPAEAAGLKEGDRIIEVNGENILGEDHKSVVTRIKKISNETKLLLVDKESAEYYQKQNITITGSLPEVIHLTTPPSAEIKDQSSDVVENNPDPVALNGNGKASPVNDNNSTCSNASESPKSEKNHNGNKEERNQNGGKLQLNMSAHEFRNQLKKKYDPKKENIDVRKKYEIIDQL